MALINKFLETPADLEARLLQGAALLCSRGEYSANSSWEDPEAPAAEAESTISRNLTVILFSVHLDCCIEAPLAISVV